MISIRKRNVWVRIVCGTAVFLTLGLAVQLVAADEVVLRGARYRDVLVHKTDTSIYVQIPWEGRTLSARIEEVDASTVSINEDPYYRDALKKEYREAKELRDSGQLNTASDDSMFRVQGQSSSNFDLYSKGSGSGASGGGGLGVPRSKIEAMLGGFGVQFTAGPERGGVPTVVGEMQNGIRLELIGPPDSLMGVDVSGSGPAEEIAGSAAQMQIFVLQIAPSLSAEIQPMIKEAQESGQSQRSKDGVSATMSMKEVGELVEFRMTVKATG